MDKQALRNAIGGMPIQGERMYDTVAIALCSYFSDHLERPEEDHDTEHGWGQWVEEKANKALDELTDVVLRLTDKATTSHT